MPKYALLSDIHGNMFALESVMRDVNSRGVEKIILLGDLIDYGMQSNEVVSFVRDVLGSRVISNIWGNHERAIMTGEYSRFSSVRGVQCAKRTASILTEDAKYYLNTVSNKSGRHELILDGYHILTVHGSLDDNYWKSIFPDNVNGDYKKYDIVLSGHSHYPHMFQMFYDTDDPQMRNKKAVLFINPGSVGQPRNHNPNAQYTILDTDTLSVDMRSVPYPAEKEMEMYDGSVDTFYRERLKNGI